MEWLFWGWLKSLIQYAFYPVVANAYLFVFGNLLIHLIDSHPPPYDGGTFLMLFFPLVMLLVAFTYGILKIPVACEFALYRPLGRSRHTANLRRPFMTPTPQLTLPTTDYAAAKRQYLEQFGSTLVMNTYLKIAVLALSLVSMGLIALNVKTYRIVRNFKPLVIRINDVGRAQAVSYSEFEYHPQEAEIKYFLIDFVERYYGRMRATVRDNVARSLYYLDGRLASAIIEANKKTNAIETFLSNPAEEIDIIVKNVSIEDLRTPPYRATVDFEKVYYSAADHTEMRREKYVGNFVFVVRDHVPNALVPVNPLGLTITYFREDQAFE